MAVRKSDFATGETHRPVFWENGKMVVPQESGHWYATVWKWKWLFGLQVKKEELAFVREYEKTNGAIQGWKDPQGTLRAFTDYRSKNGM